MNEPISLSKEELLLCERLRSLRMSGMADAFEAQMLDPNADLVPFMERFERVYECTFTSRSKTHKGHSSFFSVLWE